VRGERCRDRAVEARRDVLIDVSEIETRAVVASASLLADAADLAMEQA
jgi:hypothetical protein